jgi:Flp pilus assembly protein TadD
MLDVQLYGMNAGPQHVTNLVLHVLNTLLLFGLLHWMTGALGRSAFVAGLFAVHPLHVESVAWIAERKDVLSTLFWMLTIWAYVAYVRRPRPRRYVLVLVLFGLGLMAKQMLVTLPFVLLLLDVWPLQRVELGNGGLATFLRRPELPRLALEKLPLFALAAAASALTVSAHSLGGAVLGLERIPLSLRLMNAAASYLSYIGKMLWPVRLAAFYPFSATSPVLQAFIGALVLAGVTVMAIRAAGRSSYFLVGWLWYLGTLFPVIGVVQVGDQSMADRYTYIPLIGLFLIVAWGATELMAHRRHSRLALPLAAICVLLPCAALARTQVQYWRDSAALWQHAIDVTDDNALAHNSLGKALIAQGREDGAIRHFAEALRIRPDYAKAQNNMGMVLMHQGKLDEAARYFAAALRNQPDYALAQNNMGMALLFQGKLDEATPHFVEALRIKPDFAEAHDNLGRAMVGQGKLQDAVGQFREALGLEPEFAEAHNDLGAALARQGELDEAARHFAEALRIEPDFEEAGDNLKRVLAEQGTTAR